MSTIPLDLGTDILALPPPALPRDAGLEQALRARRSTRELRPDPLPLSLLSTLLWSAFGVNRPHGGRTAPSAHDWREIDVHAVLAEGAYRYDAPAHRLVLVSALDLRADTGVQDFVAGAPLNLVYVADFARMSGARADEREFLAGCDAGCIAQNVYLCCAASGLGCVVRGLVDRRRLAHALGLAPTQRIALAHSVGFPTHP